jgi:uncharacterized membrane protein
MRPAMPPPPPTGQAVNVGEIERLASTVGGAAQAVFGLAKGHLVGLALAGVGGSLVYRGLTGHCQLYETMGIDTARQPHGRRARVRAGHGFKVERAVTINKSPEELYRFWRDFRNLPRFMRHLQSVSVAGDGRSHWVAKAPAGTTVEWDAEVINEKPNELIAWRSLAGSVNNAGSVHFERAPGGRGTEVKGTLKYDPPAGRLGAWVAWLFGEEPDQQVADDLRRFKQMVETGEIPTTAGQASGRQATRRR